MSEINSMEQDNQQMLADSARDYVRRSYGDPVRAASMAHPLGCAPERWRDFADLGWLGLPLPEQDGGLGGSLAEICALAEELGRGLVYEPYVANAVQGAMALADWASGSLRAGWLRDLAEGRRRVALAPWEPHGGAVCTAEQARDGAWGLSGTHPLVAGAAGADAYVVAARAGSEDRMGIFLIEADAPGLRVVPRTLYDGQVVADLHMERASSHHALAMGPHAEVSVLLQTALDRAMLVACAETVGVMARVFEITLEYLKTRKQFGRAIASNQVVQHRLVDLYVEIEEARALTRAAADAWAGADGADGADTVVRQRWCAAARSGVVQAARHMWEEAVQLHGAIGMTQEYQVGQFVKRLALACNLYGGLELQLERLANAALDGVAEY